MTYLLLGRTSHVLASTVSWPEAATMIHDPATPSGENSLRGPCHDGYWRVGFFPLAICEVTSLSGLDMQTAWCLTLRTEEMSPRFEHFQKGKRPPMARTAKTAAKAPRAKAAPPSRVKITMVEFTPGTAGEALANSGLQDPANSTWLTSTTLPSCRGSTCVSRIPRNTKTASVNWPTA